MYKTKIIFLIILLMLAFSGCISDKQVEMELSVISTDLNMATVEVTYLSLYSEPQNVTINLETNDQRLGLSTSKSDNFKQSITLNEEVGSDYKYSKRIYVKTIDSSIPPGNYKITATIEGEKSKLLTFPLADEIIVPIGS